MYSELFEKISFSNKEAPKHPSYDLFEVLFLGYFGGQLLGTSLFCDCLKNEYVILVFFKCYIVNKLLKKLA